MSGQTLPALDLVWRWLGEIPDPEIPVISLTDLGVIRETRYEGETLVVAVAPTYSGCPATAVIHLDIETKLRAEGVGKLRLERRLSPPWTTDWISEEGRRKLHEYGVAPPIDGTAAPQRAGALARRVSGEGPSVPCPRCGATQTQKVSQFGSTPCKASYRCRACLEPFDYFKCI